MALSQVIDYSKNVDGKHIYIENDTGIYNVSTNPGGYGTPNYGSADLNKVVITPLLPHESEYGTDIIYDSGTTPTAANIIAGTSNADITTILTEQAATAEVFPAGVYQFRYADYFTPNVATTVSVTNGSKIVTAAAGLFTDAINSGFGFIEIVNGGNTDRLAIDSVDSNTQITLAAEYERATASGLTFRIGFYSIIYVDQFIATQKCLDQKTADTFGICQNCEEAYKQKLQGMNNLMLSAQASFNAGDYTEAQDKIDVIQDFCDNDCGCQ